MKNSQMLKITGLVLAVIGAVLSAIGGHRLSEANGVIRALTTSQFGSSDKSIGIWQTNKHIAIAFLIVGVVCIVMGVIVAYNGFLKANEAANPETPPTTPKAYTPTPKPSNTSSRLAELKTLLDSGIITAEEYEEKRKKIIDEI